MKKIFHLFLLMCITMSVFTSTSAQIEFVTIEGNDTIPDFEMAITEVTNEQYTQFLNEAYAQGVISFDASAQMVNNLDGLPMINLGGTRVIKDHNGDGTYALDEMENPLNRCFIQFNNSNDQFEMVDPSVVDWNQYFDTSIYPNAVDTIDDWAELNSANTGFYEEPDEDDLSLPVLEEVKRWPVNHIRYYGAEGFAKFYGYDLPNKTQWRYVGQGGQDFEYATSDGTLSTEVAWYNPTAPQTIWKGHAQPVMSKEPNPYGVHDLAGSIWEWCKDWYDGYEVFGGPPKEDEDFFIDDSITYDESVGNYLKCILGGSFNFLFLTLRNSHNHAALPIAGNDHFGFRVVNNDITNSTGEINLEPEFRIFPNPANNYVELSLLNNKNTALRIYSCLGQVVFSDTIKDIKRIDVSQWNKGIYYVTIGGLTKKLLIN